MKLNKKGFGVAEMAIVILLIGILAAAVIVGFLGIKKNANEHVKEEATMSIEIIHQTKHAYPTILSGDKEGLLIKDGEYEVYELGGYKLIDGATGDIPLQVQQGGTLYLSGNGTLDDSSKIYISASRSEPAIQNSGTMILSDLIVSGGNIDTSASWFQLECVGASNTTLNNVKLLGQTGSIVVSNTAKLSINGVNTNIILPKGNSGASGRNLLYTSYAGEIEINDGKYEVGIGHRKYIAMQGGTLTINGGTFKDSLTSTSACYAVLVVTSYNEYNANATINGGVFDCTICTGSCCKSKGDRYTFLYMSGNATVTITGGEFIKKPPNFVKGSGTLVITGGTFHFNTTSLGANGWEHYVPKDTHKIVDNGNGTYTVKGINE